MNEALRKLFFDACSNALDWGPGLVIALVMLYGFYRLMLTLGGRVGMKILGALENPAQALNKQAESMDRLTQSIDAYVQTDRSEHREIIMLQKVILDRIELLNNRDTEK